MSDGIELHGHIPGQDELLTPAALQFLAGLHRRFEAQRQQWLAARRARQSSFDAGGLPDFRDDTRDIRVGDWRVAALPPALLDRRVEITGPVDPKTVINALNSGANCYMADFEIRPRRPGPICWRDNAPCAMSSRARCNSSPTPASTTH